MSKTQLTREEVERDLTRPHNLSVYEFQLSQALINAWDALKGLDKFDDNNRIAPYCVSCLQSVSNDHEPDCKLFAALPKS